MENLPEVQISTFEPDGRRTRRPHSRPGAVPDMTAGRATLVVLIDRYVRGLLDPFATMLEVQKLMYFMQEAGENLRLEFRRAPRGPYAGNLRHVLGRVEGLCVSGYAGGGDDPGKELSLVPGALRDAQSFLENQPGTRTRLERVSALLDGFESDLGLELLATVHWVVNRENARKISEVVSKTYDWNHKKKRFAERQIELAVQRLTEKGWLEESIA